MSNKIRIYCLPLSLMFIISVLLTACIPMTMNNVTKEANFTGIVEEVYEESILVRTNKDGGIDSDLASVSLDVKLKDSIRDFNIGDEIKVYYDGDVAESYPVQVNNVYAIFLMEAEN